MLLQAIAFLITGLLLGGALAWLAGRARAAGLLAKAQMLEARLAERLGEVEAQRDQLAQREQEQRALQERLTQLTGELRAWECEAERVPELETQIRTLGEQLRERAEQAAALETALDRERRAATEKQALLDQAQTRFSDAFKALASEALSKNNESFLQLAQQNMAREREAAKGDLEKRQQAIGELITPLREQLARYEQQIVQMEQERQQAYGKLLQQVTALDQTQKQLERETGNLVQALRSPKVRGRWGEVTLRRVAELAGMVEYCDFIEQQTALAEEGIRRPDMVVRLPGGRQIVIDAKTPLEGYLKALECTEDGAKGEALMQHANQLHRHMEQLSQKAYWNLFNPTPDFVILFIPGESFLCAALEKRPELLERGFERKVILATPSTLVTLLRTVALGWRQEQLARSAAEISDLGNQLYERLATMGEHLAGLGSSLERSVKCYNQAVGSLERRVMVTARKFTELGVHSKKEIPELAPVEATPTPPAWLTPPLALDGTAPLEDQ